MGTRACFWVVLNTERRLIEHPEPLHGVVIQIDMCQLHSAPRRLDDGSLRQPRPRCLWMQTEVISRDSEAVILRRDFDRAVVEPCDWMVRAAMTER